MKNRAMGNRLPQLLLSNRAAPRSFRAEVDAGEGTIYLYDMIGLDFWTGEGVTARGFLDALATLGPVDTVHLRINSPGGDVFEARTIVAAMNAHPARFVAHVDGLAASAASFLAVNADEVEISKGGFLMVHNAWTLTMGDRHDLLESAALLEKVDASIADDYKSRTGAERETVVGWMDAETWFTADEALAVNLVDRIAEKAGPVKNTWNLAAFGNAPAALASQEQEATPEADKNDPEDVDRRVRRLRLAEMSPA